MTRNELKSAYFRWMCRFVATKHSSYKKLLSYLNTVEFTYILDRDGNRYEDGINLRYRFGYEEGYSQSCIATYLDDSPCSVLEMVIALSLRLEEQFMGDPDVGNRVPQWFWNMVDSLGLYSMDDFHFDLNYANAIMDKFLNRKYRRDGKGGLFTIKNCKYDLRDTEIWYQACWYLDEIA